MQCPRCQFDNPPTMHFCVECGARLERRCPSCGAEAQPTFKFCGQCGAALGGAPETASAPAPMAKAQVYGRQEAKIQSYTPRHLAEKILTARSALEAAIHDLVHHLRVELCGEPGEVSHVGEQHTDLTALPFEGTAGRQNLLGQVARRVALNLRLLAPVDLCLCHRGWRARRLRRS